MSSYNEIVSVVVITYNSAMTVLDTLDSIKNQDYNSKNIDLIITDDASTDITVKVVNSWLDNNKFFFNSVRVITHEINGGIAKNCNSGWIASRTNWIKSIAGDDILLENCISTLVKFVSMQQQKPACVFSYVQCFGEESIILPTKNIQQYLSCPSRQQLAHLLISNFLTAPSSFINNEALIGVGYADESFRLIEDYPLWIKFVTNGYVIDFVDSVLVKYRVGNSVSKKSEKLLNEKFEAEYLHSYLLSSSASSKDCTFIKIIRLDRALFQFLRVYIYVHLFKNKPSQIPKIIYGVFSIFSLSTNLLRLRNSRIRYLNMAYTKIINLFC